MTSKKGIKALKDFLAKMPELAFQILAKAKIPLKDAAVSSTRRTLFSSLEDYWSQTAGIPGFLVRRVQAGLTDFIALKFSVENLL